MQKGDKFIRYSKNGVVRGEVEEILIKSEFDLKNRVKIERKKIKSTKGVVYDYEECYKVIDELSISFCIKLRNYFNRLLSKKMEVIRLDEEPVLKTGST